MPHTKFIPSPMSRATRGHGAHTRTAVWQDDLAAFPKRTEKPENAGPVRGVRLRARALPGDKWRRRRSKA